MLAVEIENEQRMRGSAKNSWRSAVILSGIILFHAFNNIVWLYWDNTYLLYESATHFLFSFKVFDSLRQLSFPWLTDILGSLDNAFRWHGIFIQYLTAPFYFFWGATQDAGVFVSGLISLVVLVGSVFGIGKILYDENTALLAAFLVSMYPAVFIHERIYLLDLPLTAIVSLSVFLLLKSDYFLKTSYSLLFAVVAGIGCLTKVNFIFFMAGPVVLMVARRFRDASTRGIRKNVFLIVSCFILIGAGFYKFKSMMIWGRIYECSSLYWFHFYSTMSLPHYMAYILGSFLKWFFQECIGTLVTFLLLPFFLIGAYTRSCHRTILWVWILVPVLSLPIFFHLPNTMRYYMPILPVVALFSSAWIIKCRSGKKRKALILLLVSLTVFQYFGLSYKSDFFHFGRVFRLYQGVSFSGYRSDHGADLSPVNFGLNYVGILEKIQKDLRVSRPILLKDPGGVEVFFIGDAVELYAGFLYEALVVRGIPLDIGFVSIAEEVGYFRDQRADVLEADYIVLVEGGRSLVTMSQAVEQRLKEVRKVFEVNKDAFDLMEQFSGKEGNGLSLYKRKVSYVSIARDGLELYFRGFRSKIYYHGKEVSGRKGFAGSMDIEGGQNINSDFLWVVGRKTADSLVAYVRGPNLDLRGRFAFHIKNDHLIDWTARFKGRDLRRVKNIYFGLGVAQEYDQWEALSGKGVFLLKERYDFRMVSPHYSGTNFVRLSSQKREVPDATFLVNDVHDEHVFIWSDRWEKVAGFGHPNEGFVSFGERAFSGGISFSEPALNRK